MNVHSFLQLLLGCFLCVVSPLFSDTDFIKKMMDLSDEQIRAYWGDAQNQKETKNKGIEIVKPQTLENLANDVGTILQNEKLERALGDLKEVVQSSEKTIEEFEERVRGVEGSLENIENCHDEEKIHIQGEIRKEIIKSYLEIEHMKAFSKSTQSQGAPSSRCSLVTNISTPGYIISTPGHYCVSADLVAGLGTAITINASNVEVSLDSHTVGGFVGIFIDGSMTPISNIKISGIGEVSGFIGVNIINAENVTIENAEVSGLVGISSSNSVDITMKNLFISTVTAAATFDDSEGIRMLSCCADLLSPGAVGVGYVNTVEDLQIDRCIFSNGSAVLIPPNRSGTISRLSITNSFINDSLNEGLKLQHAFEVSLENVLIDGSSKGILLEDVRDFRMVNCQVLDTAMQGIEIVDAVSNVELQGCQFLGIAGPCVEATQLVNGLFTSCMFATSSTESTASMNFFQSEGVFVENSTLSTLVQDPMLPGTNGIVFQSCTGFAVDRVVIETNARSTEDFGGNGILIYDGCRSGVIQNTLLRSTQPNIMARGITALGVNEALRIEDNTIDNTWNSGIYLEGTLYSLVQNNHIRATQVGSGISLVGASGISLFGNTSVNNAVHGIFLDSATIQCAVRDNTVSKNSGVGLNNQGRTGTNKIYHNFAQRNRIENYAGVELIAKPGENVGALENISS